MPRKPPASSPANPGLIPDAEDSQALVPKDSQAVIPVEDHSDPVDILNALSPDDMGLVQEANGMEEFDSSDFRIPYWVYNVSREIDPDDGEKFHLKKNQWWNTLTNEVRDELELILVGYHKTNSFTRFDNAAAKTIRHCVSDDRVQGKCLQEFSYSRKDAAGKTSRVTVQQNTVRKCEKCPQAQWREKETDEGIKNVMDCAVVRNFFMFDTKNNEPGIIRFKKTGEGPAKDMLARFFAGKWVVKGERRHLPIFSYQLAITLEMDSTGRYATPVFRKVRSLSREELLRYADEAKRLKDMSSKILARADGVESNLGANDDDSDATSDPGAAGAESSGFDPSRTEPTDNADPSDHF